MQVHAQHAVCLSGIAALSMAGDFIEPPLPRFMAADYQHTSNLPKGRCEWLRRQIAEHDLTHAVSMDADTWCQPDQLLAAIQSVSGVNAMGIAPVRMGDGRFNIRAMGTDAFVDKLTLERIVSEKLAISAGGFGIVVFNLAWFRERWPEPEPETTGFNTGEDIEICRSVRRRDGIITALPVATTHASFVT